MSVYFIQAGMSGPIKIGWSRIVSRRLQELQRFHYEELKLLAEIPGGAQLEGDLHLRFKHLKVRGEWFIPTPELMDFIKNPIGSPGISRIIPKKIYKPRVVEPHHLLIPLLEKHGITHIQFVARGRPPSSAPKDLILRRKAIVTELHVSGVMWAEIKEITGLGGNCVQRLSDAMWNDASRDTVRENGRVVGSRWKGKSRPGQLEAQWKAGNFDRPETRAKFGRKNTTLNESEAVQ